MRYASRGLPALLILAACTGGDQRASSVAESSRSPLGTVQLANSCAEDAIIHLEPGWRCSTV
jgi:hypothetical protein